MLQSLLRHGSIGLSDLPVDLHRRLLLHGIGDVGINVQRGCRRYMTDDGGQGFHIHAVLQRHGCEGMAQIMEPNLFTSCTPQGLLHTAAGVI